MRIIQAKFETKSNFRNLNGKWLHVVEFLGSLVNVEFFDEETGRTNTCDFNVDEITEIRERK